jgi:hypothetical protein
MVGFTPKIGVSNDQTKRVRILDVLVDLSLSASFRWSCGRKMIVVHVAQTL